MRACVAVAMLAMAGAASGCGYALAGRGSYLPKDIKTVAIPPLENRTNVSRLETILTDRIRTEFIGRNRQYKVVTEEAGADAVLRAELIGFSTQTAGLNAQQLSNRLLVTIVVKASFIDLRENKVLWSNDALTFRDEYQFAAAGVSAATLIDQERSTVDRIATDAARTVVTAILEAF